MRRAQYLCNSFTTSGTKHVHADLSNLSKVTQLVSSRKVSKLCWDLNPMLLAICLPWIEKDQQQDKHSQDAGVYEVSWAWAGGGEQALHLQYILTDILPDSGDSGSDSFTYSDCFF